MPRTRAERRNILGKQRDKQKLVDSLDTELSEWLSTVPDSIKFSANNMDSDSPHLTMCVILYIVHAACVINLHRYESLYSHPTFSLPNRSNGLNDPASHGNH